jgi:hypothetical protein
MALSPIEAERVKSSAILAFSCGSMALVWFLYFVVELDFSSQPPDARSERLEVLPQAAPGPRNGPRLEHGFASAEATQSLERRVHRVAIGVHGNQ